VHSLHALDEALSEHADLGGLSARHSRYARHSTRLRSSLRELGLGVLVEDADASVCLSAFSLPLHVGYDALHDFLKREGFVVYAGQGSLANNTLRIAVMGELDDRDIQQVITLIGQFVTGHCG
jgi:2-aminoethylphosphonate-pyruvate transaminase